MNTDSIFDMKEPVNIKDLSVKKHTSTVFLSVVSSQFSELLSQT